MKFKVPLNNKEVILYPKGEKIEIILKKNREKREKFKEFFKFEIDSDYIIASGHQTIFCHPGIWAKNIFLNLLSKKGFKTKFFEHDVDGKEGIFFYYPDKRNKVKREFLYYNPYKIALEYIESSDILKNWDFIDKVRDRLPEGEIKKNFDRFFEIFFENLNNHPFYADAFVLSRREYEESPFYESIFLSDVFNSPLFFQFFSYFFINAEKVFYTYNQSIIEYRKKYKIENETEPAPLLQKRDDMIELPFFLNLRERYKVYRKKDKLVCKKFEITLGCEKEEIFRNSLTLPLRPRSLILSLYQKVFLCDLFYHGVSGKNYDEVTDLFIKKFFNLEPPETGVISLTLYLDNIKRRDFPFFFFKKEKIEELISF